MMSVGMLTSVCDTVGRVPGLAMVVTTTYEGALRCVFVGV